jgi:hypothetical protein
LFAFLIVVQGISPLIPPDCFVGVGP